MDSKASEAGEGAEGRTEEVGDEAPMREEARQMSKEVGAEVEAGDVDGIMKMAEKSLKRSVVAPKTAKSQSRIVNRSIWTRTSLTRKSWP